MNTIEQKQSYTVAELLAMDDLALNAMAAEAMGWQVESGELLDATGNSTGYWVGKWKPCTNRNHSRELLLFAVIRHLAFQIGFLLHKPFVGVVMPGQDFLELEIPGNDARAETVAFCAAMLAMEGKLNV